MKKIIIYLLTGDAYSRVWKDREGAEVDPREIKSMSCIFTSKISSVTYSANSGRLYISADQEITYKIANYLGPTIVNKIIDFIDDPADTNQSFYLVVSASGDGVAMTITRRL